MEPFTTEDIVSLNELIEDCVSYYCEEYDMSAQLAYIIAKDFIEGKINKLRRLENTIDE